MRLETVKTSVERGGNFTEKAFTIKADAKMFNLLSDKIYADKPGAVVREIASNAKDAHAAAGYPDRPFDIHLPNEMYPHFSVRDYGKGLTHEEMFEIYTTYSESTKINTNKEIGAFGVGAKSPFAYTDNFTVVSRTEGRKRTYTAYIGEEGIPVLALMNDEESDEESGLEVIVPIKNYDFSVFRDKTFSVLQYFTPRPNVVGIAKDYIRFEDHSYKYEGTGWGIRQYRSSSVPRVIQGGVYYPVEFGTVYERNIPNHLRGLVNQPIDLHFEMFDGAGERGNLDVALSREALSYDQYTREQIQKIMQTVYDEIGDRIVKDLDKIPTFWQACIKYAELKDSFGEIIPSDLKWRGGKVLTSRVVFKLDDYQEHLNFTLYSNQRGYRTGSSVHESINGDYATLSIFFDDLGRGASSRMKMHSKRNGYARHYLVSMKNDSKAARAAYKKLITEMDNPPIKNVSDLPKPEINRTGYKKQIQNETMSCYRWDGGYARRQRDKWESTTIDLKDGGYYVPIVSYNIVVRGEYETNSLTNIINNMIHVGIIPAGTKVYGVGKRTAKHLEQKKNWHNLIDVAREKCNTKDVKGLIAREAVRSEIENKARYSASGPVNTLFQRAKSEKGDAITSMTKKVQDADVKLLADALMEYRHTKDEELAPSWSALATLVQADRESHKEIVEEATQYVDKLSKLWHTVAGKFAMLNFVDMSRIGDPQFDKAFIDLVNKGV